MTFALDHVFVFCRPGAPEAQRLVEAGLRPGVQRRHEGQGTANTCFCFGDGYLELIWIADEKEARHPDVQPLGLVERSRWRDTGACPIGVCVRGPAGVEPPFPTWDYAPPYLPKDRPIAMACNSAIVREPILFALSRPYEPPAVPHVLAARPIGRCTIRVNGLAPMSLLREVRVPRLGYEDGAESMVDLQIGDGVDGRVLDLRPELPLVLRW